jgi:starch phosphorylase
LTDLRPLAGNAEFLERLRQAKTANKRRLAATIEREVGLRIAPASLFDVQVKRIHEYKRQLLNVLHVVTRYNRMLDDPGADWVPRTIIFAGKAASA